MTSITIGAAIRTSRRKGITRYDWRYRVWNDRGDVLALNVGPAEVLALPAPAGVMERAIEGAKAAALGA